MTSLQINYSAQFFMALLINQSITSQMHQKQLGDKM